MPTTRSRFRLFSFLKKNILEQFSSFMTIIVYSRTMATEKIMSAVKKDDEMGSSK